SVAPSLISSSCRRKNLPQARRLLPPEPPAGRDPHLCFCRARGLAMRRFLATALLLAASPLVAAPPTVTTVTPRGAERGKPVEIVVSGTNLTPQSRLVLPFKATQTLLPDAKPNPAQVRFQLTVDPAVPLSVYPVRVATEDGISSLFLFGVDTFANVSEVE